LELLAAVLILSLMVLLLFTTFNQASRAWLQSENRVEAFVNARAALDYMARELVQAVVATNVPFAGNTDSLAFIAPVNTVETGSVDLAEVVYRLDYSVSAPRPLHRRVTFSTDSGAWDFYQFAITPNWPVTRTAANVATLADNIVSLRFKYYDLVGEAFDYWNSTGLNNGQWGGELPEPLGSCSVPGQPPCTYMTNCAPVGVQITLGVIDSRTVVRLAAVGGPGTAAGAAITNQATHIFSTFVAIPNRQP
jgi:type II secretory pathway pseudopilin PulG